jgi:hypothetical protein
MRLPRIEKRCPSAPFASENPRNRAYGRATQAARMAANLRPLPPGVALAASLCCSDFHGSSIRRPMVVRTSFISDITPSSMPRMALTASASATKRGGAIAGFHCPYSPLRSSRSEALAANWNCSHKCGFGTSAHGFGTALVPLRFGRVGGTEGVFRTNLFAKSPSGPPASGRLGDRP